MSEILMVKKVQAENVLDEICQCLSHETDKAEVRKRIIHLFVGQWVYFPHRLKHEKRDREMLERFFSGEEKSKLIREYGISRSQFFRIVKQFHQGKR